METEDSDEHEFKGSDAASANEEGVKFAKGEGPGEDEQEEMEVE